MAYKTMNPHTQRFTLFPYTTLFRSCRRHSGSSTRSRGGSWVSTCRSPRRTRTARSSGRSPCRSEEHTSELQSPCNIVCRLLLEKKKKVLCKRQMNNTKNIKHKI